MKTYRGFAREFLAPFNFVNSVSHVILNCSTYERD